MFGQPEPETEFKPWQCGDPYQCPIPDDGEDHWAKLLEPKLEEDRIRCEAWREEVQNLLIFAGLFSAVVSAFAVLSYPGLQPDQDEIMINLLAHIAIRLDSPSNTSSLVPNLNPTTLASPISASSIRVNVFWFMSLVLSLTSALIGIVSLQWLREHQNYPPSLSSKDKFAIFGMRVEGLEAWYVPQILSSLPLFLQSALVLFFVGLIDFLLVSSSTVAIPVVICAGIPLAFLAFTTTSSALQIFVFYLPVIYSRQVPVQVPYKSTQSRLFRQTLAISATIFTWLGHVIYVLCYLLPSSTVYQLRKQYREIPRPIPPSDTDNQQDNLENQRALAIWRVLHISRSQSWIDFDQRWIDSRYRYANSIVSGGWYPEYVEYVPRRLPVYDLVNTMVVIGCYDYIQPSAARCYLCIQEILSSPFIAGSMQSLRVFLGPDRTDLRKPFQAFSSLLQSDGQSPAFLDDEVKMIFLAQANAWLFGSEKSSVRATTRHYAELQLRVARYLFSLEVGKFRKGHSIPKHIIWMFYCSSLSSLSSVERAEISDQASPFIRDYLQRIIDPGSPTIHEGGILKLFDWAVIDFQSAEAASWMLTSLSTKLENSIRGKLDETSDFLFYASSYYLHNLVDSGSRQWEGLGGSDREAYLEHSVVGPFISTLRKYLDKRGTPDQSVPGRMGLPDPSDKEEPFFGDFLNFLQNKRQDVKVEIITDKNSEPPLDEGDHIEDPPQIGNDASKLV